MSFHVFPATQGGGKTHRVIRFARRHPNVVIWLRSVAEVPRFVDAGIPPQRIVAPASLEAYRQYQEAQS